MSKPTQPDFAEFAKKVSQARYMLNRECPFLAALVNRVPVKFDASISTACVVNRGEMGEMWLNPEFFSDLGVGETTFVVAHEVMHLAYSVFPRFKALGDGADMPTFNEAHDYVINAQLAELVRAFPKVGMKIPSGDKAPLLDPKLSDGKGAEKLYRELLEKKAKQPKSKTGEGEGGGTGAGQGEEGQDGQKPPKPSGKGYSDATDCVMEPDESPEKSVQRNEEMARRWQNALAEAATIHDQWRAGGQGRGDLPGSVKETVKAILTPEVNWTEQVFQMAEGSLRGGGVSYARPSKRGMALDVALPGRGRRRPRLAFVIDTSGSMGTVELSLVAGVGMEIASVYDAECRMIHVDSGLAMDEEVEDLATYFQGGWEAKGRGGTVFEPAVKALCETGEPVDLIILLTDGGVIWPDHDRWPAPVFVVTTEGEPPAPYKWAKVKPPRRSAA